MFHSAMVSIAILMGALPATDQHKELKSVTLRDLAAGDRLELQAAKYVLRLDIVNPATGEAMASLSYDGVKFGEVDRVFVLGATRGRHPEGLMIVNMGRLEVGKGVELAVHTMDAADRLITDPVQSFRVLRKSTPSQR